MLDNFLNLSKVNVSAGYDAVATTIVLATGHGAKLPATPFNAVWYDYTDYKDPSDDPNVEVVRVTAVSTDTLTVTRGQESTSASTKNTSAKTYKMIACPTAKTFNSDMAATFVILPGGRLTLTTALPVTTSDVTAATSFYYTPYVHDQIPLFDGTNWKVYSFSEITVSIAGFTASTLFDVFAYASGGAVTLETLAWSNSGAGTSTRATALVYQNGRLVKSGATTRLYLGTFRTTGSTGQTEDSAVNRLVFNQYNRVGRRLLKITADSSWTYTSQTYRQANANAANQVNVVVGQADALVNVGIHTAFAHSLTGNWGSVGIGVDSTTTHTDQWDLAFASVSNSVLPLNVQINSMPAAGYHNYVWLEATQAATCTFYGTAVAAWPGLFGSVSM